METLPPHVRSALQPHLSGARTPRVGFLTGAGISSESGIPTFRGPEGYWTVGSKVYHPMELATNAAFREDPWEVWRWYLYREATCRESVPNAAHLSMSELAKLNTQEPLPLMTQNVDGLHRRADFPVEDLFEIHGSIGLMRCAERCSMETIDLTLKLTSAEEAHTLSQNEMSDILRCPKCNGLARPHVLWFDEYYEEALFRSESALRALDGVDVLITVGTSAATNLPVQTVQRALSRNATILDINPGDESPFGEAAERYGGAWWRATACEALPELAQAFRTLF